MSDVGIMILLFVGVVCLVVLIKFLAWLTDVKEEHGSLSRAGLHTIQHYVSVRRLRDSDLGVMSRNENAVPPSTPLSQRQTAPQTDRQAVPPVLPRNVMLDMYRLMRKYGIPREEARPIIKAAGVPLDNNLWTLAAPDDDTQLTPIAGRPTSAQFQDDLEFHPPPR